MNSTFYELEQRQGKRVCQFLKWFEHNSIYDFSEESSYTESILGQEIKQYFKAFEMQEPAGIMEAGNLERASILQQMMTIFQLNDFEKMCVELVLLGEVNPFFEKFFVYMNNDWNNGYLTLNAAISLYTMDSVTNAEFYLYFAEESRLLTYFLQLHEQAGKGRGRWSLRCKERFWQILFSESARSFTEQKDDYVWAVTGNGSPLISVMNTGYGWDDLVLPMTQKEQLKNACNRVLYKNRIYDEWGFGKKAAYGRGVSMVFSGPPGTGKTMCASVVADYLDTMLYRVNLAAIVSKYIGETEKNLSSVFDAVKKSRGVLFFDEADVLFSKRTQVNNSNDKHSNMEAAYLLQKMEEYEGIVILATNYMQNMDEAFKRRIQFLIEFPFPNEEGRRELWEKVFPAQIPFSEVPDYEFLANQFELSGSHIKNIALQAAFYAADENKGVNMEYIIKALLSEVRKTGKKISREELREYYIYYE